MRFPRKYYFILEDRHVAVMQAVYDLIIGIPLMMATAMLIIIDQNNPEIKAKIIKCFSNDEEAEMPNLGYDMFIHGSIKILVDILMSIAVLKKKCRVLILPWLIYGIVEVLGNFYVYSIFTPALHTLGGAQVVTIFYATITCLVVFFVYHYCAVLSCYHQMGKTVIGREAEELQAMHAGESYRENK
ncbi:uncharacterized protein LOC132205097 [Neocloeon triangulifer]|uniref:uncharacterized protein LOC132205097 n=1 Tax=Neocloeon triangulifer TaxID=2078957 RepID=UPI00286F333C|nr:uncharacterized protein LOC132205097 [Neocloeon triangulifer]